MAYDPSLSQESVDYQGILSGHAPADDYSPTERESDLAGDIEIRFQEAMQARNEMEYDWELNRGYLEGHRLYARHTTTDEVLRVFVKNSKQRFLSRENVLRPIYWAHIGKRTRIIPTYEVKPANADDSDVRGAQAGTALLRYQKDRMALDSVYLKAHRYLPWAGTSFIELEWDRCGGQTKAYCSTCQYVGEEEEIDMPCPQCQVLFQAQAQQANQQAQMQWETAALNAANAGVVFDQPAPQPQQPQEAPTLTRIKEGDVKVSVTDTRVCFPSPGDLEPGSWRYFITRVPTPVVEIRKRWPDKGRYIQEEDGIYTEKLLSYSTGRFGASLDTTWLTDHAYLYTYHERPTLEYPNGRLIYMANGIVLEEISPHPVYKVIKRLPFFMMRDEIMDDMLWGRPRITQVRPVIDERNRLLSQMRAHRDLTNRPWLIKPQRVKLSVDEVDDTPGRILEINAMGGPEPKFMRLPEFPQYCTDELERMEDFLRKIFQVTAQEMGISPTDQSGRHAAIVEAQSSESIRPALLDNLQEWKQLHIGILQLSLYYYDPNRVWTVQGKDRVKTYKTYHANLRPGWDLTLEQNDTLSRNPALRLEQTMGLHERLGYFVDPRTGMLDQRRFAAAAGLTEPGVSPDVTANEHLYFSQVPEMLARGEPFIPQPWDDAHIAVEELVSWLRGPGRSAIHTQPQLVQMVGQYYMYYFQQVMMTGMRPDNVDTYPSSMGPMQQPGQPQQQQQAGGQNPMAVGGSPQQGGGSVAGEAKGVVKQADAAGEQAARTTGAHEG